MEGVKPPCGRDRLVPDATPIDETEKDVLEYILPIARNKLRVFRCSCCHVRIANECDTVQSPSLERQVYVATFTRTFNLVRKYDRVCCFRCGNVLFPYDDADPLMLTLPLYINGTRVFDKTVYRILTFVSFYEFSTGYLGEGTIRRSTGERVEKGVIDNRKNVEKLKLLSNVFTRNMPDKDVEQTNLAYLLGIGEKRRKVLFEDDTRWLDAYYAEGVRFQFRCVNNYHDDFQDGPVYDFVLHFKSNIIDNSLTIGRMDYDFTFDYEEILFTQLWLCSGGNILFGDWHVPRGLLTEYPDFDPDTFDFNRIADQWMSAEDWEDTNRLPSFCQLCRDGHYFGFYAIDKMPSMRMIEKWCIAADNKLLYPTWLFLHDLPQTLFTDTRRAYMHGIGNVLTGASQAELDPDFLPYICSARDYVLPVYPTCASTIVEDNSNGREASCIKSNCLNSCFIL